MPCGGEKERWQLEFRFLRITECVHQNRRFRTSESEDRNATDQQWVVGSFQFTTELLEHGGHLILHLLVLGLGQARVEWVALQRTTASDTRGDDELVLWVHVDQLVQVAPVRRRVLVGWLEAAMVFLDHCGDQKFD